MVAEHTVGGGGGGSTVSKEEHSRLYGVEGAAVVLCVGQAVQRGLWRAAASGRRDAHTYGGHAYALSPVMGESISPAPTLQPTDQQACVLHVRAAADEQRERN